MWRKSQQGARRLVCLRVPTVCSDARSLSRFRGARVAAAAAEPTGWPAGQMAQVNKWQ